MSTAGSGKTDLRHTRQRLSRTARPQTETVVPGVKRSEEEEEEEEEEVRGNDIEPSSGPDHHHNNNNNSTMSEWPVNCTSTTTSTTSTVIARGFYAWFFNLLSALVNFLNQYVGFSFWLGSGFTFSCLVIGYTCSRCCCCCCGWSWRSATGSGCPPP